MKPKQPITAATVKMYFRALRCLVLPANGYQIILRAILQISASFSLYKDLATVYLEVDANVTMEGLMLLEQSRRSNFDLRAADENFERQQRNLLDYNNKAKERVFAVVKHVSERTRSTLSRY